MASPAEIERKMRQLPRWSRAICWALGVSFGGVGSYAVFATDNQAGTAALLIVSALFSIIALTGSVPKRMQFGDSVVEWPQQVTDAVTTAIEEGSPDVAEKVATAISESVPDRVISIATNRLTGLAAERLAQATLTLAAVQLEDETRDRFSVISHFTDGMVDFEIVRRSSHDRNVHDEVPIVVKRVGRLRHDFVQNLATYADNSFSGRVVLILYGELTVQSVQLLATRSNVYVVQVDSSARFEEAVDKVKQCLRTAFRLNADATD